MSDQNKKNTVVFNWIKCNKEPVPCEIIPDYCDMTQCNENGFTAAMAQICYHRQLPQKELMHSPDYKDSEDMTLAHWWIERVKTLPPPELLTKTRGPYKMTLAMFWADIICTPVPKELIELQSPEDTDLYGKTLAMHWAMYIIDPVPKEIYHSPYITDHLGRVFHMYSLFFNHEEPSVEMQVALNYHDVLQNSVYDYMNKFVYWA